MDICWNWWDYLFRLPEHDGRAKKWIIRRHQMAKIENFCSRKCLTEMVDHMTARWLLPVGLKSSQRHIYAPKWHNMDIKWSLISSEFVSVVMSVFFHDFSRFLGFQKKLHLVAFTYFPLPINLQTRQQCIFQFWFCWSSLKVGNTDMIQNWLILSL